MRPFNVLDRQLSIHQNYLLEASAGTGKTFSIQNIVVRLLIESNPIPIEKILIVTFTRAATRELKNRIRSHIKESIADLMTAAKGDPLRSGIPDYLLAHIERGTESINSSKIRLQQALFTFDRASIFTIHGFCSRMLREYSLDSTIGLQSALHENSYPNYELHKMIRDFFRTELFSKKYTPRQLSILLKSDPDQLQLLREMKRGYEMESYSDLNELFHKFQKALKEIVSTQKISSDKALLDFESLAPHFKNSPKLKENKSEVLEKVKDFVTLFDKSEWSLEDFDLALETTSYWIESLDPALQKKSVSTPLHYPNLTKTLKETLEPIIYAGSHFPYLLGRLTQDCLNLLKEHQKESEKLFPDDFLKQMNESMINPDFTAKIRSKYGAALIDEFQDTDPIQWNIFKNLFLPSDNSWNGYLYLVGDPKQSIYSFRQADIYTYLNAVETMGKESCYSLDTNYRSHPALIDALNTLFGSLPEFIPLPKQKTHLPYRSVKASYNSDNYPLNDSKGAIHFFVGDAKESSKSDMYTLEEELFFPFIHKEIIHLNKLGLPLDSFTLLVRDRYQALRLTKYLQGKKIHCTSQRGLNLAESPLLPPFISLLQAIVNPKEKSTFKLALGSLLIGIPSNLIKDQEFFNTKLPLLEELNLILKEQGLSVFIDSLLHAPFGRERETIIENLLSLENGDGLCNELYQMIDHLLEAYHDQWIPPSQLPRVLDDLFRGPMANEEETRVHRDPSQKGVNIITLHYSKGLEFEVVFALGLANPVKLKDLFFPVEKEGKTILSANLKDESAAAYLNEIDAEKMRQLYVAMTRAKTRLYVPFVIHLDDEPGLGEHSPMNLFLKHWKKSPVNQDFLLFLDQIGSKHHISYSIEKPSKEKPSPTTSDLLPPPTAPFVEIIPLVSPPLFQLKTTPEIITSFSKLNTPLPSSLSAPYNFSSPEKTLYSLPAGKETGIFIHQLLEKISFSAIAHSNSSNSSENLTPLLHPFTQNTPYQEWLPVITQLIYSAFKNPLLNTLSNSNCYREMPFILPFNKDQTPFLEMENLGNGCVKGYVNGYVNGVIDLIFMKENLYYILDWKTTWLGPSKDDYTREKLHQTMIEKNYFVQALFYIEALKRYLALVDPRPFEECFGGIIYFFLRGVDEERDGGVYLFKCTDHD